jgi:hypothetical protein
MVQAAAGIPMVINDEQFGANYVRVTLEWFQNEAVFSNVLPPASVGSVGDRSVQLIIPYNIEHSVSVAICGQPSSEAIKLYYSKSYAYIGVISLYSGHHRGIKFGHYRLRGVALSYLRALLPINYSDEVGTKVSGRYRQGGLVAHQARGGHQEVFLFPIFFTVSCDEPTSDDLTVINYTAPAPEGSIIAIECDSLSPNNYTSTCVEGRWEPNLNQISARCRGMLCMGHSYIELECIRL